MALRKHGVYSIDRHPGRMTPGDSPRSLRMQGLGIVPFGPAPAFTPTTPLTPTTYRPASTATIAPLATPGVFPDDKLRLLAQAADRLTLDRSLSGADKQVWENLLLSLRRLGGPDSPVTTASVLAALNLMIVTALHEGQYDGALAYYWPGMTTAQLRRDLAPSSTVYNAALAARLAALAAAADASRLAADRARAIADAAAAASRATADAETARIAADAARVADEAAQVAEVHEAEITATDLDLANQAAAAATPYWKPALAALFGFGLGAIIIRVAT